MKRSGLLCVGVLLSALLPARAAEAPTSVLAGHSAHGEAFNEGPRQKARLLTGTGKVHLPVTTRAEQVQAFIDQGVGQLHGFWYFEAERTFRQAAALDPDCAMAYWGMAMANVNNATRAKSFIAQATTRKAKASRREQLWIEAYAAYFGGQGSEQDRRRELVRRLEDIRYEFPGEIEARAFLAFQLWDNASHGIAIPSKAAVDAIIQEVLDVEPMHPVHHYRIHLWDGDKPERALASAARCGQSSPTIAHMWHMSGHIFVGLHRYADAAWQQEASARVDHRHMMEDGVLPDQIFNYAHNNQWLIEDLEFVGRAHDAVALAKNMIELPRHPRYNTLNVRPDGRPYGVHGSSSQGRRRLIETLYRFEMWDEAIRLANTVYLEPTALIAEQVKRLRLLGVAYFTKGDRKAGQAQIAALEKLSHDRPAAAKASKKKDPKGGPGRRRRRGNRSGSDKQAIAAALGELRAYDLLAAGDMAKAKTAFDKIHDIPTDRQARIWLRLGDGDRAERVARDSAQHGTNQVHAQSVLIEVLWQRGKKEEAKKRLVEFRPLSGYLDLDVPTMRRLALVAHALGWPADWRVKPTVASDVGVRPPLAALGPVHWQPTQAPDWTLPDANGRSVSLHDYRGKPVVVIFFLGTSCGHCVEQLSAFAPMVDRFRQAGIALVAISIEPASGLKRAYRLSKLAADVPVLSDHSYKTFKAYRAFDDFENVPLHGTFFIDGHGLVRWHDISYEPFTDVTFLLTEAKRLLSLPTPAT
ncbi:MAG TPA: peroxiredoxin family protein, partial [Gemmataceae bacterium]|nr:peroxiredoxin family protein [Gemmataceae bacterium]